MYQGVDAIRRDTQHPIGLSDIMNEINARKVKKNKKTDKGA